MKEEAILGWNKLIAEFMGYIYQPCSEDFAVDFYKDPKGKLKNNLANVDGGLDFHKHWELLMPVVEKIENLGHTVDIWNNVSVIPHLPKQIGESKIEAVYKAVVQFITWYNQQK